MVHLLNVTLKFHLIPSQLDKAPTGKWHIIFFELVPLFSQEVSKTEILVRFTPSDPIIDALHKNRQVDRKIKE